MYMQMSSPTAGGSACVSCRVCLMVRLCVLGYEEDADHGAQVPSPRFRRSAACCPPLSVALPRSVLSRSILSYHILSYLVLSYPFYLITSYPIANILSYNILS